jgi:hypothetical protein
MSGRFSPTSVRTRHPCGVARSLMLIDDAGPEVGTNVWTETGVCRWRTAESVK